jgi:hypothetical protein
MYHPTTMLQIAKERQDRYADEAARDRLVKTSKVAANAAERQEPRERFSVRDLRWLLFRPTGA